jgi:hypothetical protein
LDPEYYKEKTMDNTDILNNNREVYNELKKSFEKIHYENPKDPFKVFNDIEKVLKSEIDNDENVDRIYFKPLVQDYINWTQDNYDLLRSPKKFDRLKHTLKDIRHFITKTLDKMNNLIRS